MATPQTLLNELLKRLQSEPAKKADETGGVFGGVGANLVRAMEGLSRALLGLGQTTAAGLPGKLPGTAPGGSLLGQPLTRTESGDLVRLPPGEAPGGRLRTALGGIGGIAGGAAEAVGGAAGAAGGIASAAVSGIRSFTSSLATAAAAPITAFSAMTAASYVFVNALNPSALLVFNQALRDLTAVIGVALEPIIQVASGVLRELGATLLPVMAKLRPIVEQIANAFGDTLMVSINALGSILTSLMPAFEFLAGVVKALVPVFQAVTAFLSGWTEALIGMFRNLFGAMGITMGDVTGGMRTAFEALSKYTLLAAAHLAVLADKVAGWFGMETTFAKDFASGVKNALTGTIDKKDATGLAAAQNAQVGGIADFTKTLAQAAFIAGPSGAKTKDAEEKTWRENLAKQVGEIAAGKKTDDLTKLLATFQTMVEKMLADLIRAVTGNIYEGALPAPARGFVRGFLNPIQTAEELFGG